MQRIIKKTCIVFLIIYLLISYVGTTYAYWNKKVYFIEADIILGEWTFIPTWSSDAVYNVGDIVYFEGSYYIRIKKAGNSNQSPSSPSGSNFWKITDNIN